MQICSIDNIFPKRLNPNFLLSEIKLLSEATPSTIFKLTASGPVILLEKMTDSLKASGDSFKLKNIKVKYKYEYVSKIWLQFLEIRMLYHSLQKIVQRSRKSRA